MGELRLSPVSPVALFAYPESGAALASNLGRLHGQQSRQRWFGLLAYDRPDQSNVDAAPITCQLVSGVANLSDCSLMLSPLHKLGGAVQIRVASGNLTTTASG